VTRAMQKLYLTHARRRAVFGAQSYGLPSRFLDEIPAELLDRVQAPALHSWSGASTTNGGSSLGGGPPAGGWGGRSRARSREASSGERNREAPAGPAFRMGEDVVHAAFGEGVVTGVEPGGVIVVRFADDGSERKLMAEYALLARR
jgi:DNA helicase-2/ATP-dependent DNA helicase PcrA